MTTSEALHFPAEKPGIIEATGADAVRFLNGQVTQEVRGLDEITRFACITDAKGKLQHFVEILEGPEKGSVWIVSPAEEVQAILTRLDRYLIADEVELSDRTGGWTRVRIHGGEGSGDFARQASWPDPTWTDHWSPVSPEIPGARALSEEEIEEIRIQNRVPRWGAELAPGMLPPEAGLDRSATSFTKGCYIGQETLSRIKSAGKLNRRLMLFEVTGSASPGDPIATDEGVCGELTSVAPSGDYALGYVKKKGFVAERFILPEGAILTPKKRA